jgi:serine phosphatase RsbU (regulator of sigma subunit)
MPSTAIIAVLLIIVFLILIGYNLYKKSNNKYFSDSSEQNSPQPVEPDNTKNRYTEELQKVEAEKNNLQQAIDNLTTEKKNFEVEKKKIEEKNKKVWLMNETVYKEKKKVDELNEKLYVEKEKLEAEKKKVEEKVKKLWSQSMAIHKEKERINELKVEIEKKHTEIIDSVNYAKRIQEAILPDTKEITSFLPNSFILFHPRDIVSGDFYWFSNKDNKSIIAAIDCTGHGVPGAFMSMIGNTLLNQIVNEKAITDPAQILNNLNFEISRSLKQTHEDSESRDGMDGAICCFEFISTDGVEKEIKLHYAGANRPLYFVRNDTLEETKANKFPIGGIDLEVPKAFTTHTFTLQSNDTIYIFTDGYADQFGSNNKKLMTKKFKEVLNSIQDKSMDAQKSYLEAYIQEWKGTTEQTDDILVIGIKI